MRSQSLLRFKSSVPLPCIASSTRCQQRRTISVSLRKLPAIRSVCLSESSYKSPMIQLRLFQSESEYHSVADETLEDIQDAVERALEVKGVSDFDVTYASGVLTMILPPHGTYVLNKQTPNRQIWWSSPKTGPRRYEYEGGEWVFTRDESQCTTLVQTLKDELYEIYGVDLEL